MPPFPHYQEAFAQLAIEPRQSFGSLTFLYA
jgi:hypothetical protein